MKMSTPQKLSFHGNFHVKIELFHDIVMDTPKELSWVFRGEKI